MNCPVGTCKYCRFRRNLGSRWKPCGRILLLPLDRSCVSAMASNVSGGPYSRRWRGKGKGKGGGGKWKAAGWAMSDDAYEQLVASFSSQLSAPSVDPVDPKLEPKEEPSDDGLTSVSTPPLFVVDPLPPGLTDPTRSEYVQNLKMWLRSNFTVLELEAMLS